ncbi:hypothetical protein TNCV_315391 [Trichonephila clavipes]|nr:hypothetical protein TNCV_315391 [Trichonephila clavipes]
MVQVLLKIHPTEERMDIKAWWGELGAIADTLHVIPKSNSNRQKLEPIYNAALRLALGLPRNTPLDLLRAESMNEIIGQSDKPQALDHLEDNIRRVIADIRPQMLKKSSKIGHPDWTTSEPAVAVLCQKSYLKSNAPRLSFE